MLVSYSFSVARLYLVSWNSRTRNKGTPFSNREGRSFVLKRAFLCIKETPSLFANSSLHSPLHSERGGGEAVDGIGGETVVGF